MQTFLPYPSFKQTAHILDNARLNKQITEARQILTCLHYRKIGDIITPGTNKKRSWINHPAVIMWEGCEEALKVYANYMLREWRDIRGKNYKHDFFPIYNSFFEIPFWMGDIKFHSSHKSNLLKKNKDHYGKFGWIVPDNLPYVWPIKNKIQDIRKN